jgi:hypothetical protein
MTISAQSLMKAIRATSEKAKALETQIDSAEDPALSYLEEEWHSYLNALSDLQKAYVAIQSKADNLPPYEELVESQQAPSAAGEVYHSHVVPKAA